MLASIGYIISELCKKHFNEELHGNWLQAEQPLIRFFHERITQRKHHCILSSLLLLKKALSVDHDLRKTIYVPSALAIALRHDVVWRELPKERKLNSLKFSKDPLAFLLMFCDCVQEWGRPQTNESSVSMNDEELFLFEKCDITGSKCSIIISSPYLSKTEKRFKDKFGAKSEHHMIGSNT